MTKCLVLVACVLSVGCGKKPGEQLAALSTEFVDTTLSFTPSAATGVGLHEYQKQKLDEMLDDVSGAGLDKQRRFYQDFQKRVNGLKTAELTAEDRADLSILQDQTALALLELNEIHSHSYNPTLYVEALGSALFSPLVLEYAPKPARIQHIIARLQKVPLFLDQAMSNLIAAPPLWNSVAIEENEGNIELVDKVIRAEVPAESADAYAKAAKAALDSMNKFQSYLKNSLSERDRAEWRLGQDRYTRKFRYALSSGMEADIALAGRRAGHDPGA